MMLAAALLQMCSELSCTKVAHLLAICCQEKPRKAMQECFLTSAPRELATSRNTVLESQPEEGWFAAEIHVRHQRWYHQNPQKPPGDLAR